MQTHIQQMTQSWIETMIQSIFRPFFLTPTIIIFITCDKNVYNYQREHPQKNKQAYFDIFSHLFC